MSKILQPSWFERDTVEVARDLLGKHLVFSGNRETVSLPITETEAYVGSHDLACHASKGRTPRTEVMYGPPGRWYIYLIYGMYDMLNIVTMEKGHPAAVLIRGVEGYNGPGKLTKALGITRELNSQIASRKSRLWIEDKNIHVSEERIEITPRIGVDYAKEWATKPYRFVRHKS